jgi:hypothetical protein
MLCYSIAVKEILTDDYVIAKQYILSTLTKSI